MTRIESYLAQVRVALRGLPEREIDDILRELRSHAEELAGPDGANMDAALQSLGDPVDLAKTYRAENTMVRAECASSPLVILQGLRHATRTRTGRVLATALYAFGYINVLSLWATALDKVFGGAPTHASELLGWWLVPIAIAAGFILRYLIDQAAKWWIRRHRRQKNQ
ncbi:MAG TPA: hypothetical protein VEU96_18500 [Bryobacteraceae bacterium]|nr:hypothetical protein [Bryobacteraceae bacterium]